MEKLLASSLARVYFDGEITIFRDTPHPIFKIERARTTELLMGEPKRGGHTMRTRAWEKIEMDDYGMIVFLDSCLALSGLDHLFKTEADLLVPGYPSQSTGGNPSDNALFDGDIFAVRSGYYHGLMENLESLEREIPTDLWCKSESHAFAWRQLLTGRI